MIRTGQFASAYHVVGEVCTFRIPTPVIVWCGGGGSRPVQPR
jgi:hypothetical protein